MATYEFCVPIKKFINKLSSDVSGRLNQTIHAHFRSFRSFVQGDKQFCVFCKFLLDYIYCMFGFWALAKIPF